MFTEYESTINRFLKYLGETNPDRFTSQHWHLVWAYIKSDFCTSVADVMKWACVEHDFYFRTHHDFEGKAISFMDANKRFRIRMQRLSRFGVISPLAWWRWAAVCVFARSAWEGKKSYHG